MFRKNIAPAFYPYQFTTKTMSLSIYCLFSYAFKDQSMNEINQSVILPFQQNCLFESNL